MTSSLQQNKGIEADVDNVDFEFLLDPGAAAFDTFEKLNSHVLGSP